MCGLSAVPAQVRDRNPIRVRMVRLPSPNLAQIRDQNGAGFPSQNEPLRRRKTKNGELPLLCTNTATTAEPPKDSHSSDAYQPISEARRRPLLAYLVSLRKSAMRTRCPWAALLRRSNEAPKKPASQSGRPLSLLTTRLKKRPMWEVISSDKSPFLK